MITAHISSSAMYMLPLESNEILLGVRRENAGCTVVPVVFQTALIVRVPKYEREHSVCNDFGHRSFETRITTIVTINVWKKQNVSIKPFPRNTHRRIKVVQWTPKTFFSVFFSRFWGRIFQIQRTSEEVRFCIKIRVDLGDNGKNSSSAFA